MQKLEHPYKPILINTLKKSDAIVVLGGMLSKIETKNNIKYEFGEANRFLSSIELINQNKADKLIFMATKLPWLNDWKPEGYLLKEKAISLGVNKSQILVSENIKNTYDESIGRF